MVAAVAGLEPDRVDAAGQRIRQREFEIVLPSGRGCSGDPAGPRPDVASMSVSDVTVAPVATAIMRCAPTLPSRRFSSIDASPLPSVTNNEYQCRATIAPAMLASV